MKPMHLTADQLAAGIEIHRVAEQLNIPLMLVGAQARYLAIDRAVGVHEIRKTEDIDFAVIVETWGAFYDLRKAAMANGAFEPGGPFGRLKHQNGTLLDLLPCGGVEETAGEVKWPGAEETFTVAGIRESFAVAQLIEVSPGTLFRVITPAGLTVLKLIAYPIRSSREGNSRTLKDLQDLLFAIEQYGNIVTEARLLDEVPMGPTESLFKAAGGAYLLGKDAAALCQPHTLLTVSPTVEKLCHNDENNIRSVRKEVDTGFDTMTTLLKSFYRGFTST